MCQQSGGHSEAVTACLIGRAMRIYSQILRIFPQLKRLFGAIDILAFSLLQDMSVASSER